MSTPLPMMMMTFHPRHSILWRVAAAAADVDTTTDDDDDVPPAPFNCVEFDAVNEWRRVAAAAAASEENIGTSANIH